MIAPVDRLIDALASVGCQPKRSGNGWEGRCPAHEDGKASLTIGEGDDRRALIRCFAGCDAEQIVSACGLKLADLFDAPKKQTRKKAERREVATYDYTDETGKLLFQCVRLEPKAFLQRRPLDGVWAWGLNRGWYEQRGTGRDWFTLKSAADPNKPPKAKARWLDAVPRVLYRLPAVASAIKSGLPIILTEGEKDAIALNQEAGDGEPRFVATCNPMGAGNWPAACGDQLAGAATVRIWRDKDPTGEAHARTVAAALQGKVRRLEIVESKTGKDAFDHLAAGYRPEEAIIVQPAVEPRSLTETLETFARWHLMPDPGAVLVTLGTYAANRMAGAPVWLLIVGPPSGGKTETILPLAALPDVHLTSTLSGEAALLSGTSKRDKDKDAQGGLLREIGASGTILCKDFGSILSLNRDTRAAVLAALREIFDGRYSRRVGTDGGRLLDWEGKAGFIAACTPTIDRHHAVMATMGERFIIFRLPELQADGLVRKALEHAGKETIMRAELAAAVRGLVQGLDLSDSAADLTEAETVRMVALSRFIALARAPVEREGHRREIELIPGPEAPTRISITLKRLLAGLRAIGTETETAWTIIEKIALDCLPMIRRRTLAVLANQPPTTTSAVAESLGYPTTTTRRALEDLTAYGLAERESQGQGRPDLWRESSLTAELREAAFRSVSEMSGEKQTTNGSGGVSEMSGGVNTWAALTNTLKSV